jgi:hypothetical protein
VFPDGLTAQGYIMKFFDVESHTEVGKFYKVRVDKDGIWRCSCIHFLRYEKTIVICKHILGVMKDVKAGQKNQSLGQYEEESKT